MNIIKLLNKICAVNLSEPCRDDLKRLSEENKFLVDKNKRFEYEHIKLTVSSHNTLAIIFRIKEVLTHPSYNSDEKLCEIKLLIDEVKNNMNIL